MVEIVNSARQRLEAGQVAAGIGLRQARTVDIAPAMKTAGFDWLFIDLEHNAMTLDMAVQLSVTAVAAGIAPIVRVPYGQYDMATRVLDGGAMGIVVPHVDTAEEAKTVVDRLKYPPAGHRSVAGGMPQIAFAPVSNAEAAAAFNKAMLIVVMLETPTAIANCEAIAAVPGIDVVMIGTSDLTMEMGVSGQLTHPEVVAAYEKVIAACGKHGKWAGMGGVYVEDVMKKYIGMGVRLVLSGNDLSLLMTAATQRAKLVKGAA
ncbi:MAG: HpcH/HpaI aldolase/citrate lyase family protein [Alphaproteobacteria bacterium]